MVRLDFDNIVEYFNRETHFLDDLPIKCFIVLDWIDTESLLQISILTTISIYTKRYYLHIYDLS